MAKDSLKQPVELPISKPSVSFYFSKDSGMKTPENFDELKLDKKVTVTVTGKITSLSLEMGRSSISLEIDEVDIATEEGKAITINEAVEKAKEDRKL